jgi:hypothetical protein
MAPRDRMGGDASPPAALSAAFSTTSVRTRNGFGGQRGAAAVAAERKASSVGVGGLIKRAFKCDLRHNLYAFFRSNILSMERKRRPLVEDKPRRVGDISGVTPGQPRRDRPRPKLQLQAPSDCVCAPTFGRSR